MHDGVEDLVEMIDDVDSLGLAPKGVEPAIIKKMVTNLLLHWTWWNKIGLQYSKKAFLRTKAT